MVDRLSIRDGDLRSALDAITRIRWDFDSIGGRCDDVSSAVGHDRLGRVLDDFADNWRIRRRRLSEDLQSLESSLRGTLETFGDVDEGMANALRGDGGLPPGYQPAPPPNAPLDAAPPDWPPDTVPDSPPDAALEAQPLATEPGPTDDLNETAGQAAQVPPPAAEDADAETGGIGDDVPASVDASGSPDELQAPGFRSLGQTLEAQAARIDADLATASAAVAVLGGMASARLATTGRAPEGPLTSWLSSTRSTSETAAPATVSRAGDLLGRPGPSVGPGAGEGAEPPAPVQDPPFGGPAGRPSSGPGSGPVDAAPAVVGGSDHVEVADRLDDTGPAEPRTSANASLLGMGAMSSLAAMQSAGANRPTVDDHERLAEAKRLLGRASEEGSTS